VLNLSLRIDLSSAKSPAVGSDHGITPNDQKTIAPLIAKAHSVLQADRRAEKYGFFDLHNDRDMVRDVKKLAADCAKRGHENMVVLGIGGSALGLTTLVTALKPPYYNLLDSKARGGHPRVFVMDNIDPVTFNGMLTVCPPEKTLYVVISKSGGTAETLAQALIVFDVLEKAVGKSKVKDHALAITGPGDKKAMAANPVHVLRQAYGLPWLPVPANVGGRFSVFSPVGLFPAAMLGIDIDELLAGCKMMDGCASKASITTNPAYARAAYHYLACRDKGKSIAVMMPYSDQLRDVADWYRQLWAESLGKRRSLDGKRDDLFAGQTPVKSLGATDQHSQLQLYLEGPNDKLTTLLSVRKFSTSLPLPPGPKNMPGVDYLAGRTMARLIQAECSATRDALVAAERPVISVELPEVRAHTIGQLLYMLEVETAMAGQLFGVNAFDQPAVEAIKVYTRQYMRQGK
jgi:glucose-6-phosphate isomerase